MERSLIRFLQSTFRHTDSPKRLFWGLWDRFLTVIEA